MSSKKSAKYASSYTKYRQSYEKAYFAHSDGAFMLKAKDAVNYFLYAFIFYSFDDDELVINILKRKAAYGSITVSNKKPSFYELLSLAYASPRHSIIDAIPIESFKRLYEELVNNKATDSIKIPAIRSDLSRISNLFDSFSFDSGDINKKLANALKECRRITENGYKNAKLQIRLIFQSISEVESIIESTCSTVQSQGLNDPDLSSQLVEQLRAVQVGFTAEASKAQEDINEKRITTDNYNITLFGRTNVGKSTLMEILTNGSGISIGKGGQRTTKDVRQYQWNGLSITDVPGIDAYDGQVDEVLAERASRFADQIVFMITSGQPENIEADWLVRLKRKDKPMLCVCNVKRTVATDKYLQKFIDNPGEVLDKESVSQAIQQFREFVKQKLPNEDVPFVTTHLQTRFLANSETDEKKRQILIEASRFKDVENAILCDVINYGKLYRKRCYISILDVPIFEQMIRLFCFSGQNFHNLVIYEEKQRELKAWQKTFVKDELESLDNSISIVFDKIERHIGLFVDEFAESKDFGERWNRYLEQQNIESKVESLITASYNKAKLYIENVFKDLSEELELSQTLFSNRLHEGGRIVDWGKGFGWGSGSLAVIAAVLAWIPGLQPFAVALGITSAIMGGISAVWKSREKRLRQLKEKKETELRMSIREQKENAIRVAKRECKKNIESHLIKEANNRFTVLIRSINTLAWSQRSIGFIYMHNHINLTQMMLRDILDSMGFKKIELFNVARVPGKSTVFVTNSNILEDSEIQKRIGNRLGSKEEIIAINHYEPLYFSVDLFNTVSERLGASLRNPKYSFDTFLENEYRILTFKANGALSTEDEEKISLLEQLFDTHIVLKN